MGRVLVTGASGFIGRQFVRHLEACGHVVLTLMRRELDAGPELPSQVDAVVHLAARAHQLHDNAAIEDGEFLRSNAETTSRLAAAALRAGVRRFVFVSSAGVLGATTDVSGVDDESPTRPYDAYTRSKCAAERLLREYAANGLDVAVVRPPLVYGPGARGNFARLESAVRRGIPLPVASLKAPRSVIGLRNLCDALHHVAVQALSVPGPYLLADAEDVSVSQFGRDVAHALRLRARQFPVPVPLLSIALRAAGRAADVARLTGAFVIRGNRIAQTGWRPPYSRSQELAWTYGADGTP